MNDLNCKDAMRNYLLNRNGLYKIRWPLALIVSVVAINILYGMRPDTHKVFMYILAVTITFIIILLINIFANTNFSHDEYRNLVNKCQNCVADPNVNDVHRLRGEDFANYNGLHENFITEERLQRAKHTTMGGFQPFSDMDQKQQSNLKKLNEDSKENQQSQPPYATTILYQPNRKQINKIDEEAKNKESFVEHQVLDDNKQNKPFIDDRMYNNGFPLGDSYPPKQMSYQPVPETNYQRSPDDSMCMLGRGGCSPLCSGSGQNPCNIVAPVPGPQWQPQSAAAVQQRLTKGNFVPANCDLGPVVLRKAQDCTNLKNYNDSREPIQVTCNAAQIPKKFN